MLRRLAISAVFLGLAMGEASAQYYPYGGYGPPGSRCDAFFRTPYGPQRTLCPMGRAKPVGAPCACPSANPYGPPARGRVIP